MRKTSNWYCKVAGTNSNNASKSSHNVTAALLWQNQFYSIGPWFGIWKFGWQCRSDLGDRAGFVSRSRPRFWRLVSRFEISRVDSFRREQNHRHGRQDDLKMIFESFKSPWRDVGGGSVWQHLSKFRYFGKEIKLLHKFLRGYLEFGHLVRQL